MGKGRQLVRNLRRKSKPFRMRKNFVINFFSSSPEWKTQEKRDNKENQNERGLVYKVIIKDNMRWLKIKLRVMKL